MSFSIKQLLVYIAVAAIGLTAIANADKPFAKELIDLLALGLLIFMAYSAWISDGQQRAFRIGFVTWGVLYYWLVKRTFDIGTTDVLVLLSPAFQKPDPPDLFGPFQPPSPSADWGESYYSIGNALFLLLFALIGGWVTVFFYRKRRRILDHKD